MSDWGWVASGYGITYVSLASHMLVLRWRKARLLRQMESVR